MPEGARPQDSSNRPDNPSVRTAGRTSNLLGVAAIVIAVIAVFHPLAGGSSPRAGGPLFRAGARWSGAGGRWVNWAEDELVRLNPTVSAPFSKAVKQASSESHAGYYAPGFWLCLNVCHKLWGFDLRAFQSLAIGLHAANAVLCFFLFSMLCRSRRAGFLGAMLWAVHPLRVEPVAAVSQLKVLLSGFFCLLSGVLFLMARSGKEKDAFSPAGCVAGAVAYVGCVLAFLVAATIMPSVAHWPLLLLIVDRFRSRLAPPRAADGKDESLVGEGFISSLVRVSPLLIIGAVLGIAFTASLWKHNVILRADLWSIPRNLLVACYSVGFHLSKIVVPDKLGVAYRLPEPVSLANVNYLLAGAGVVVLLAVMKYSWRDEPWLSFGLLFYLVGILPYSQLIPALRPLGDRYTYLASLALFAAVGRTGSLLMARMEKSPTPWAYARAAIVPVLAVAFCVSAISRMGDWRDCFTLWGSELRRDRFNAYAWSKMAECYSCLADEFGRQGRLIEGRRIRVGVEVALRKSWQSDPTNPEVLISLASFEINRAQGEALFERGVKSPDRKEEHRRRKEEALARADSYLSEGMKDLADCGVGIYHLAKLKLLRNDFGGAEQEALKLLKSSNTPAAWLLELGRGFSAAGRSQVALQCLQRATELAPESAPCRSSLAFAQLQLGQAKEARVNAEKVLEKAASDLQALSVAEKACNLLGDAAAAEEYGNRRRQELKRRQEVRAAYLKRLQERQKSRTAPSEQPPPETEGGSQK